VTTVPAATIARDERRSRARWQGTTLALLFFGYAGYYFCRANLSVGMPLILDELHARGMDAAVARIRMGEVASLGVLAYAIGKLLLAGIADVAGGKRNFLAGMGGAVVFTLVFAAGGSIPFFSLAWIGNRFIQAAGWGGLVKVASRWFDFSSYGTVMGVLSVSYLLGDAAARQVMGGMIAAGFGWRSLFVVAALVMLAMLLLNGIFLRESRQDVGFTPSTVNPVNVFRDKREDTPSRDVRSLVLPLVRSPQFLIVCALSLATTLVRESFNTWLPTYFTGFIGMSEARAAVWSSVFPGVGVASVLLTGWLSDRMGARGRSFVMGAGLATAGVALLSMGQLQHASSEVSVVGLTGVVALGLIGPYSCLAGSMAMDYGGAKGSALSSGLIDGVGYLGGVFAGEGVARLSVMLGWGQAFICLAIVCAAGAVGATGLFRVNGSAAERRTTF
jgi:OPA family glycerol-3-phosphate transporter-like MFS transporter